MPSDTRIVSVLLPQPLPEPFDYELPEGMEAAPGSFVVVPLGPREMIGVVWSERDRPSNRKLKAVSDIIATAPALPQTMRAFIDRAARYVCAPVGNVLAMAMRSREGLDPPPTETLVVATGSTPDRMTSAREKVLAHASTPQSGADLARAAGVSSGVVKGLVDAGALAHVERELDPPFDLPNPELPGRNLTGEQQEAAQYLRDMVRGGGYRAALLDGVTGSGKTEVYFEAIAEALRSDPEAQVLVLLPEIALTQAVTSRFEERFGAIPAEWHSAAGSSARRRVWREVAAGRARIVVGARSALFLPFRKLKLIVIDEEHDQSYKQEEGVIYHARDLGVLRASMEPCAIVLASATPALESMWNAQAGRYAHLRLSERPGIAVLPSIAIADMRTAPPEAGRWIGPDLTAAIEQTLAAKEQALLFLNRRGYAPLVICRACGERLKAPDSDSWLVEHRYTNRLVCHLTGFTMSKPLQCPHCGAKGSLTAVGPGVERLAEEVHTRFHGARVEVLSSDTVTSPESLRELIARMEAGAIDILIGTQIVAKGHNFPTLTLVGVVDADAGLRGGDLRAGERTFQLLQQVAGRAGRADKPGRAIIQTYAPESPAIALLAAGDRDAFLAYEMDQRRLVSFPPFGRLGAVIVSAPSAEQADEASTLLGENQPNATGVEVWGPAPAPITILRGRHRRRFLVRSDRNVDLSAFLAAWKERVKLPSAVRVTLDVEPYSFM
ncbi:MAG: primosomal protein N' [Alphaproteobacteria bacterium 32-64-14]|nr:MAG: primosomal protein N' [Alphaproteobacteria bacterium 32-64-14]